MGHRKEVVWVSVVEGDSGELGIQIPGWVGGVVKEADCNPSCQNHQGSIYKTFPGSPSEGILQGGCPGCIFRRL